MTIAVDLGRKATKQTNKFPIWCLGLGVVLDCNDSLSLPTFLLFVCMTMLLVVVFCSFNNNKLYCVPNVQCAHAAFATC